jgi:aspartate/methionine/tyrosine aminotransferase
MTIQRLRGIPGFSIDRVAAQAGSDPEVLRMENLDTDLPPPEVAVLATERALRSDDANSYLPFTGTAELRAAVAAHLHRQSGTDYDPDGEIVITCGGTEGLFDALLAVTDPGDEVVLTDPTYAGMTNRVRMAGGVARLIPWVPSAHGGDAFRLDLDGLRGAVNQRTRALFLMNPSMPSGAVLDAEEWTCIAELCRERSLVLIYNAAMERILYDGRSVMHPSRLPGMRERTLVVGSMSKEYCMIGWRIGWVAGPREIIADVARAHIYNVVTPTGISQAGAAAALLEEPQDVAARVAVWQDRRDAVLAALDGYRVHSAAGGWSMLLDVAELGRDSFTASQLLLEHAKIAATPMRDWGEVNGDRFVRLVFSNEPVARLVDLRERVDRAFRR